MEKAVRNLGRPELAACCRIYCSVPAVQRKLAGKFSSWLAMSKVDPVPTMATVSYLAAEQLSITRVPMACHFATAHSHRLSDLLLKATRGIAIAVVSCGHRKRRQPGFATGDPELVGWHQLVRGIQRS
jgi:hypothetical protein